MKCKVQAGLLRGGVNLTSSTDYYLLVFPYGKKAFRKFSSLWDWSAAVPASVPWSKYLLPPRYSTTYYYVSTQYCRGQEEQVRSRYLYSWHMVKIRNTEGGRSLHVSVLSHSVNDDFATLSTTCMFLPSCSMGSTEIRSDCILFCPMESHPYGVFDHPSIVQHSIERPKYRRTEAHLTRYFAIRKNWLRWRAATD